jgi:magnesium chelatase subunit H
LYKGLQELNELIGSYQTLKESGRGVAIVNTIMDKCRLVNLDQDINLPDKDAIELTPEERDNVVGQVYRKLMEIESRLLPCGLHVIGKPPSAEEAIATLVNIASLDRDEEGVKSLLRIIANSIGRDIDELYANNDKGILEDVELLQAIIQATRAAVAALVQEQTDAEGRVSRVSKLNFFNMGKKAPWVESLHTSDIPTSATTTSNPCLSTWNSASSKFAPTTNSGPYCAP